MYYSSWAESALYKKKSYKYKSVVIGTCLFGHGKKRIWCARMTLLHRWSCVYNRKRISISIRVCVDVYYVYEWYILLYCTKIYYVLKWHITGSPTTQMSIIWVSLCFALRLLYTLVRLLHAAVPIRLYV